MESMGMIERVAMAIYEKRNGAGCRPWSRQPSAYKAPYLDDARAAIEEMRVPTENMLDSGACYEDPNDAYKGNPIYEEGDLSRDVWTAMINAALREKS